MVRQVMVIESNSRYDENYPGTYDDQARMWQDNFIGAVNQALATLPNANVQIDQHINKAVVSFDMQCNYNLFDVPSAGAVVTALVTRQNFSSGDTGIVMDVDQSPIGPLAIVQFIRSASGGHPATIGFAAMQLNEFRPWQLQESETSPSLPFERDDEEEGDDWYDPEPTHNNLPF